MDRGRKRRIKAIIVAVVIVISSMVNVPMLDFDSVHEVQAASMFAVSNLQIKRTDKKDVTLTWNSVWVADGYEVYMKAGKGAFKKYKSTKTNAVNIGKLKTNTTYQFKVRAYSMEENKKKYHPFSKKTSIKMKASVYLTDIFDSSLTEGALEKFNDKAFTMCNVAYAKGFTNYSGLSGSIVYYINDDFSKMSFDWGTRYSEEFGYLTIYGDDEILFNGTNPEGELPETVTLDVSNVNRLTFSFSITGNRGNSFGYTGVGNIKLIDGVKFFL